MIWIIPAVVAVVGTALMLSALLATAGDIEATVTTLRSSTAALRSEIAALQTTLGDTRAHAQRVRRGVSELGR